MPHTFDTIIIGAGAAGLMCAITTGKLGKKVLILEKANKIGKKILISGGGRCNFTNLEIYPENYLSNNPHFCKSALSGYTNYDFMALMQEHNLSWSEKTLGQLFCDQKAPAIVNMLAKECEKYKVVTQLNVEVQEIAKGVVNSADGFLVHTDTKSYQSTSLVVATGGVSIPKMGATDFALQIAKQFDIPIIEFTPALVPLVFQNHCFRDLSGASVEAVVSCNGISFRENVLITHKGLSGPAILQISSYWDMGDEIYIDLLPDTDAKELLQQLQEKHPKSHLATLLSTYLPQKLAHKLIEVSTDFTGKPLNQIARKELLSFAEKLNNFAVTPNMSEGFRVAEVSKFGIDTHALSSKTMQSTQVKNLYFIGEAVDVTGWLGGYNFQWAWASGVACGMYC